MSDDWIYIGGYEDNPNKAKIGKTTKGIEQRHTSSQADDYSIHTAFNIHRGDVHAIEKGLITELETVAERRRHASTGNLTEVFNLTPTEMVSVVETYIEQYHSGSVTYENQLHGDMSRYERNNNDKKSRSSYVTGNNELYETDLGNGHFHDHELDMEGYRDEDGNVYWKDS
ncbi:GIY-YIG nuclease family protein [Vibrio sp. R78045]|uniref:GIY-YIG nuclease family protein n=1 Tax=Vibrio sp. R78045 TaxID=3093868 RepID=UPI0036F2AD35